MHRIFSSVSTSEPTPLNYPGFAASCGVSFLPPTLERLQLSNWTFTRLRDFKVSIGVSPKISAPTLWQFNWSQPIPPRSGGKYSPKTSHQNKKQTLLEDNILSKTSCQAVPQFSLGSARFCSNSVPKSCHWLVNLSFWTLLSGESISFETIWKLVLFLRVQIAVSCILAQSLSPSIRFLVTGALSS